MKQATIKIKGKASSQIRMSNYVIMKEVIDAIKLAEEISKMAVDRLNNILSHKKRKKKKKAWKNDKLVKSFFGKKPPSIGQMRKTRRRIKRAHRRISKKRLVIRVLPQPSRHPNRRAQNLGSIFSPRKFKVFPAWFGPIDAEYDGNLSGEISSDSDLRRAAIIIHELNHDLFLDQKLNGKKVYGEKRAKELAKRKPRRARRSSENIEWFCMRLQDPTGKL